MPPFSAQALKPPGWPLAPELVPDPQPCPSAGGRRHRAPERADVEASERQAHAEHQVTRLPVPTTTRERKRRDARSSSATGRAKGSVKAAVVTREGSARARVPLRTPSGWKVRRERAMQYGLKVLGFGFVLAAGLAVSACGGEDDGGRTELRRRHHYERWGLLRRQRWLGHGRNHRKRRYWHR